MPAVERRQGKPVLYDPDDFVDGAVVSTPHNDLSGVFLLRLRPAAVARSEVVPVAIGRRQGNRPGAERVWFAEGFTGLGAGLIPEVLAADRVLTIPAGPVP